MKFFAVFACLIAACAAVPYYGGLGYGHGYGILGHNAVIGAPIVSHTVASPLVIPRTHVSHVVAAPAVVSSPVLLNSHLGLGHGSVLVNNGLGLHSGLYGHNLHGLNHGLLIKK